MTSAQITAWKVGQWREEMTGGKGGGREIKPESHDLESPRGAHGGLGHGFSAEGRTDGRTGQSWPRARSPSLWKRLLWQEQDGFPRAIRESSRVVVGFWRPCRGFLSRNHAWTGGAGRGRTEVLPRGPACGRREAREGRVHSTGGLPAAAVLAHRGQVPPSRAGVADGNPSCGPAGRPAGTHKVHRPCVPVWGALGQHRAY